MTDTQIVLQGFMQAFRNFIPGMVVVGIGLTYAIIDERRCRRAMAKVEKTNKRNVA